MKIFSFIGDLFLKVFRRLKPILRSVFKTAYQIFLDKIKDIAIESIKKLATTDLGSGEKREQAFKEIKEYATTKMLTFDDSDIYLAIELFHKNLKNEGVIK